MKFYLVLFLLGLPFIDFQISLANVLSKLDDDVFEESGNEPEENSTKPVFEDILNVNQETGNVMRKYINY